MTFNDVLIKSISFLSHLIRFEHFYIVAYHNIVKNLDESFLFDGNNVSCSEDDFESHLRFYKENFNVICYSELGSKSRDAQNGKHDLIITFDDGYGSFYELAAPLLKKYQLPATVFLPTDYIGTKKLFWWDEVAYLCRALTCERFFSTLIAEFFIPDSMIEYILNNGDQDVFVRTILNYLKDHDAEDISKFQDFMKLQYESLLEDAYRKSEAVRLMNWDQIKELSREGIEFGSHTMSHIQFDKCLNLSDIEKEINLSKALIEDQTGTPVYTFCYPAGREFSDSDKLVNLLSKYQYKYACLMTPGVNSPDENPYFHKRLAVTSDMSCLELSARLSFPEIFDAKISARNIYLTAVNKIKKLKLAVRLLPVTVQNAVRQKRDIKHLFIAICDHYEPYWNNASHRDAYSRVKQWSDEMPDIFKRHRDSDGRNPVYSFFYPEEEYKHDLMSMIASLCHMGYGEVEIHLHHDNDSSDNLNKRMVKFKELLSNKHGLLSKNTHTGEIAYGFIHGNWALDNSRPDGRWCGVNDELTVLQQTGCYADFTMPSAPSDTQTRKVNSIYYAIDDPEKPKSHDTGKNARYDSADRKGMLLVQGPLLLRRNKISLKIENGELSGNNPATMDRLRSWVNSGVSVEGKEDWCFIKLHTHGTQEKTTNMFFKEKGFAKLFQIVELFCRQNNISFHYTSARQMVNVIHALEDGEDVWDPRLLNYKYRAFS